MKRWIGFALILVPILAPAASFWDGNAALQRGDAAFEGGMFAASNSFAPDTQVVVQNLETGKTAKVTITQRVQGQSDILVLLSPAAATALGIGSGTLVSVRVTIAPRTDAPGPSTLAEQTISQDPDLNPGAAFGGPQGVPQTPTPAQAADIAQAPSLESLPVAEAQAPPQEAAAVPTSSPEAPAAETPPVQTAVEQTPQPADQASAEQDATILSDAAARSPQKQVFLPPREDKTFAYQPPAPQPEPAAQPEPAVQPQPAPETAQAAPAVPQITAVIGEPGAAPTPAAQESPALAEAAAPEESRPEEIVGAESTRPVQGAESAAAALASPEPLAEEQVQAAAVQVQAEPVQTEITDPAAMPPEAPAPAAVALLAPEAPAPTQVTPAETQQSTVVATTVPSTATANAAARPATQAPGFPATGTWYVQLAAYATEKGAQDLASKLAPTYPTLVIAPASTGSRMFKVVVGPLNKAESGTLLVWFRFRGFPDAFVKQE